MTFFFFLTAVTLNRKNAWVYFEHFKEKERHLTPPQLLQKKKQHKLQLVSVCIVGNASIVEISAEMNRIIRGGRHSKNDFTSKFTFRT